MCESRDETSVSRIYPIVEYHVWYPNLIDSNELMETNKGVQRTNDLSN